MPTWRSTWQNGVVSSPASTRFWGRVVKTNVISLLMSLAFPLAAAAQGLDDVRARNALTDQTRAQEKIADEAKRSNDMERDRLRAEDGQRRNEARDVRSSRSC